MRKPLGTFKEGEAWSLTGLNYHIHIAWFGGKQVHYSSLSRGILVHTDAVRLMAKRNSKGMAKNILV